MFAVTDVTSARLAERLKDGLVLHNEILPRELQHRVANSLRIIANVLMQSARHVQSDETRTHLHDAHNRVMSIATLQSHLAFKSSDDVELRQILGGPVRQHRRIHDRRSSTRSASHRRSMTLRRPPTWQSAWGWW